MVLGLAVSGPAISGGETAYVMLKNNGAVEAGASHVKVCTMDVISRVIFNKNPALGDGWCGSAAVPPLAPAETLVVEFLMPAHPCGEDGTWGYPCYPAGAIPGEHEKCALADVRDEVDEEKETNNVKCTRQMHNEPHSLLVYLEEELP